MKIILFDGDCNFCNGNVQFILKRDPLKKFKFASLQSEIGQELLKKYKVPVTIDSIVLIEHDNYYVKSTAAMRISRNLTGLWKFFYVLSIVPLPIRNFVYDLIAKNRHKLTKTNHCMLPKKEDLERFL